MAIQDAIATFGAEAKNKLGNPAARGAPEDQLRAPLEKLIKDLAALSGISRPLYSKNSRLVTASP